MTRLEPTIHKLPNGLTAIYQRNQTINSVSIYITVGAGPRYEDRKSAGLAHFLEHMLFEGTKNIPTSKDVGRYIEKIGGQSSAWTDKEYVTFYVKVPGKHIEKAFYYLSEILFNSKLELATLNKEKKIILQEMLITRDRPDWEIWDLWYKWIWTKNHPLGNSILGYNSTIKSITLQKLRNYLNNLYQPSNMALAVVGNFDLNSCIKLTKKHFGFASRREVSNIKNYPSAPNKEIVRITKSHTKQAQILFGVISGLTYNHKDRYTMTLIANILGGGSSSRLFHKLVYELNLVYTVNLGNIFLSDTGFFYTNCSASIKNIPKLIKTITAELEDLKNKKLSNDELAEVKEKSIAELYFTNETSDYLANLYATQAITQKKIVTLDKIAQEIGNVTKENIQTASRKYFRKENYRILIKGPFGSQKSNLKDSIKNGIIDK